MLFIVLVIETQELGNTLVEVIECYGMFETFEDALVECTALMRLGHDVIIEQEVA